MSKQENKALVPERRFSEFRDAGGWVYKPFEEIFKRLTTKNSEDNQNALTISAQLGLVSQLDYFNKKVAAKDLSAYYLLHKGDFAYNKSYSQGYPMGTIKRLKQYDKGVVSTLYMCFRTKKEFNESFFEHYFETGLLNPEIGKIAQEGGRAHGLLNVSVTEFFKDVNLLVPETEEQQKIADCLTSVDELITAQSQKLAALKTHKKGLMQQLFPAEGETVPKLRFPEFWDKGEWAVKKLEELARRGSGHTPNKQVSSYYNGGIKWVSLADSNKLDVGYIYNTKIEISKEGIENSSAVLHPAGTVILSRDAGVGKSAVLHSEMAISQHFIAWDCNDSELSNWFLYYKLQILKPTFERIAVGSTIKTIGLPYFKEMHISIPSLSEQQKIASCLASLDELIATQTQKLDALKAHKKGLMQQLFPAINEVNS
ncbi:restriction endonuclease subunit S [Nitrosomonas oligotropha]|uniref:Type I restriction enzyme, S subunit n=1 Tax=Nitrosomonas oligotropha TaxID=42354 RepID=A0A1H8L5E0_9PROT|nr:restriction endonuclease subunit S [Nitrosomonas oligotropha]SDW18512.1 type I restriction enzyme, S subunit [Nitrosomonas oligotropha]SEN99888.1 type I restriction enzyme, S subunit [Nitrosomonas oligotropha]